MLGLLILAVIPIMPFTEQFARESVPKERWSSPTFQQINLALSTAWGVAICAIGASRLTAVAISGRRSQVLLGEVLPVVIIVSMIKFSQSYPDRAVHAGTESPGTRPAR